MGNLDAANVRDELSSCESGYVSPAEPISDVAKPLLFIVGQVSFPRKTYLHTNPREPLITYLHLTAISRTSSFGEFLESSHSEPRADVDKKLS